VQRPPARRAGEPAGQGEQSAAQGLGDDLFVAGAQPEDGNPAQQVVGEGDEHQPGGIGEEPAGGVVAQPGTVFGITDGELDDGVAAVVGVQLGRAAGRSVTNAW
jgi:hypothetical protein